MGEDRQPDSTMTKLMRSSAEDAILHRALTLPTQFPGKIVLVDNDGRSTETKYVFESSDPVGEGGTAIVYRVRDVRLNVIRALKVLLVDLGSDPAAAQRWQREQQLMVALERVNAPCIPTIHDVGVIDGLPAIVMQFVEGVTLAERMPQLSAITNVEPTRRDVKRRLDSILDHISPLIRSLAHVEKHFAGTEYEAFAHGDIKPSNIIVEPALADETKARKKVHRVWLLDFGEASFRPTDGSRGLTPAYASPEQLADWAAKQVPRISKATDQYQLGLIFRELMNPVRAATTFTQPRAMRDLLRIAEKMTARQPEDRFPTFGSIRKAIRKAQARWQPRVLIVALIVVGTVPVAKKPALRTIQFVTHHGGQIEKGAKGGLKFVGDHESQIEKDAEEVIEHAPK